MLLMIMIVCYIGIKAICEAVNRMAGPRVVKEKTGDEIIGFDIDDKGLLYCLNNNHGVQVYSNDLKFLYEYQVEPSGEIMFYINIDGECSIIRGVSDYYEYIFTDGEFYSRKKIEIDDEWKEEKYEYLRLNKTCNGYEYALKRGQLKIYNQNEECVISLRHYEK